MFGCSSYEFSEILSTCQNMIFFISIVVFTDLGIDSLFMARPFLTSHASAPRQIVRDNSLHDMENHQFFAIRLTRSVTKPARILLSAVAYYTSIRYNSSAPIVDRFTVYKLIPVRYLEEDFRRRFSSCSQTRDNLSHYVGAAVRVLYYLGDHRRPQ